MIWYTNLVWPAARSRSRNFIFRLILCIWTYFKFKWYNTGLPVTEALASPHRFTPRVRTMSWRNLSSSTSCTWKEVDKDMKSIEEKIFFLGKNLKARWNIALKSRPVNIPTFTDLCRLPDGRIKARRIGGILAHLNKMADIVALATHSVQALALVLCVTLPGAPSWKEKITLYTC